MTADEFDNTDWNKVIYVQQLYPTGSTYPSKPQRRKIQGIDRENRRVLIAYDTDFKYYVSFELIEHIEYY